MGGEGRGASIALGTMVTSYDDVTGGLDNLFIITAEKRTIYDIKLGIH
jgi:hypothetical protein